MSNFFFLSYKFSSTVSVLVFMPIIVVKLTLISARKTLSVGNFNLRLVSADSDDRGRQNELAASRH